MYQNILISTEIGCQFKGSWQADTFSRDETVTAFHLPQSGGIENMLHLHGRTAHW
jgi:hypothetical protein